MQLLSRATPYSSYIVQRIVKHISFTLLHQVPLIFLLSASILHSNSCTELINSAGKNEWKISPQLANDKSCPMSKTFIHWMSLKNFPQRHSLTEYIHFLQAHPNWPHKISLVQIAETRFKTAENKAQLKNWFTRHEPTSVEAHLVLLSFLNEDKQYTQLSHAVKNVWQQNMMCPHERKKFYTLYSQHLTTHDHYARYRTAIKLKNFSEAEQLIPLIPQSDAQAARLRLKLVSRQMNFEQLPIQYQNNYKFIQDYIDQIKSSDPNKAIQLYLANAHTHQKNPFAFKTTIYLAREAINNNNPEQAYKILATANPSKNDDSIALEEFRSWIMCDFLQKPKECLTHLTKITTLSTHPATLSRAHYWMGRCYENLNNPAESHKWYQKSATNFATFYGQMALRKTNKPIVLAASPRAGTITHTHHHETNQIFQLIKVLSQTNHAKESFNFLKILFHHTPSLQQKLDILQQLAQIDPSLAVHSAFIVSSDTIIASAIAYPVTDFHNTTSTPNSLALAIARQESAFNPVVTSSAGAMGLMQLMPATARTIAKETNFKLKSIDDLFDARINTKFGCYYLQQLLTTFDQNMVAAIASYNAGPNPVKRWIQNNGVPNTANHNQIVKWIEMIPYAETRNYVKKVLANESVYQKILSIKK